MEIKGCAIVGAKNFAVLDLGTHGVRCASFSINKKRKINILASKKLSSNGIKGGGILNVESAISIIDSAIGSLERATQENIDDVYINVADCGMHSANISAQINIGSKKITKEDILKLKKRAEEKVNGPVLHSAMLRCQIDGVQEVSDPLDMYGNSLSAQFNVLYGVKTLFLNLENALSRCSLRIKGCSFSAYSSAIGSILDDELEMRSAVLDIGCYQTSVAVFQDQECKAAFTIPVGSMHITKDIACGLGVSASVAERLKVIYSHSILEAGQASKKIKLGSICNISGDKEVMVGDIAAIVKPRLEEILEMSYRRISGCSFAKVIITGGGSKISGISEIASQIFTKNCRVQQKLDFCGKSYGPEYSSLLGLIKIIKNLYEKSSAKYTKSGYIKKILKIFAFQ